MTKTIFITSFEGVETKNVLRTSIFSTLLSRQDIRIVIFTKDQARADYHKREFGDTRISYEVAESFPIKGIDRFFQWLKFAMLNTETTRLRRKMVFEINRNVLQYYIGLSISWLLARKRLIKLARFLDLRLVKVNKYDKYFEKYKPNLVFLANIFYEPEIHFLRSAKKFGVCSIGFINSWDKVTGRCVLRLLADKFVVFNDTVKEEFISVNHIPEKDIFVGGVPQYDLYFEKDFESRDEFFRKIKADPAKKLIVYAPMGSTYSNSDWDIIDLLWKFKTDKKLDQDPELFARFPPNDPLNQEEIKKRPWLKYEQPGIMFSEERGIDWDLNFDDLRHLKNTLYHMSLIVCYASSISVDAAIFDKPVININFEIRPNELMVKSPTQFYRMTHYKKALETGGIKMAESSEKLLEWINRYINNPEVDREGRGRLVREQCQFTDGKSGERIGNFILENIKNEKK
ncbi:hypothetical protein A3H04_00460 [Candidatus Giovannonibacteria bacterium RIFCSPLOWO2_12_FULL_43_11c]|uniref:UDP-glycosyltransferase n=1 Tax=Candidatus Giovannonibacteria bacterium RIFCSPHIGHO2_12_FULL_43_15 TaxID=1798341 RepID=A0A1F5WNW6_9BACT|nr:MAG: hypothetical protein A2739_03360 [Candidatus Giovannonibacteria bacterium RIFCSPHIGHO2_01_FULL_43_100]OGF66300.1 MAG: hypothetical protein A3B97_01855 [Candidatus Giovannonibacteria bacterium RIFCSPHIGHO2_02_FULL_43_32]OGF77369.1 MAG: hypothetical protein A3F23_00275 [Candidatus Giovannonibacteria bacterium RIFCSPHIGHO2_12_FULL_43_15]OGF79193.1 MAG: hypothetical protein A3A15_01040 [Candidatus Giovannonibacteria bacterium RIFCSPLOWO2_01_FULL_43_60]OGF92415.1 MAG: hypothetical protein A3